MRLPDPSAKYDIRRESERNRILEQADTTNLKRGQDIELSEGRMILRSPNGTRYAVTVDNAGNLGTVAL